MPVEDSGGPVCWPRLTAAEAGEEWPALLAWVSALEARYPTRVSVPQCWWRHPEIVELLAALRDHERGSFTPTAPASAAMGWQHALCEVAVILEIWTKRRPCAVPGRGHTPPALDPTFTPQGWGQFLTADLAARRAADGEAAPAVAVDADAAAAGAR